MTITIAISDVQIPSKRCLSLARETTFAELLRAKPLAHEHKTPTPPATTRQVEAMYESREQLVGADESNAFVLAARKAFYGHYPLELSPDAVWFCLAQGFAQHINLNAEALRSRFVKHKGKLRLVVTRPDFVLGQQNPWPEVFTAFSEQIAMHTGKLRDLVVADFSTTGPLERAATEIVLMDAVQEYFVFDMKTGCGIPSVTLLGTPDDWRNIRRRAAMLSEFDLEWWTDVLLPILDELVRSAEGKIDRNFWRSFFRYQSSSTGSELTGWILTLFPYLKDGFRNAKNLTKNQYLDGWKSAFLNADSRLDRRRPEGPAINRIPNSVASAPVQCMDVRTGEKLPLRFVAGLLGVIQREPSLTLVPEFGWVVLREPTQSVS